MKKFYLILLFSIFNFYNLFSQGTNCASAGPFCGDVGVTYPAGVNNGSSQPSGNNYSCGSGAWQTVFTQPNAAWFYFTISESGSINIDLTNTNNVDVDFVCWGPFSDLPTALSNCGALSNSVDCSYNPQATEYLNLSSAVVGQVYLLMITNFSNQPTQIIAEQTSGTGATDCSIVFCDIEIVDLPDLQACSGQTLSIGASNIFTGTPDGIVDIIWMGGSAAATQAIGGNVNVSNPSINIPAGFSGQLNYTVTISDDSCPPMSDDVTIDVNEAPSPVPASISACSTQPGGNTATFNLLSVAGEILNGGPGTTINWFTGPGTTGPISNFTNYTSSGGTVVAQISTANGCSATTTVTLTVLPTPTASNIIINGCETDFGTGQAIFNLSSYNLDVSAGSGTVTWYSGPGASNPIGNPSNFSSGPTTVTAVVSSGGSPPCTSMANVTLQMNPAAQCTTDPCIDGEDYWDPNICNCVDGPFPPIEQCQDCPQVNALLSGSYSICEGDLYNTISGIANPSVNYSDPNGTFNGYAWYTDNALTQGVNPANVAAATDEVCSPQSITLYLGILCTLTSTAIKAGSIQLMIYPEYHAELMQLTEDECVAPTLVSNCPNYQITPAPSNPPAGSTIESGTQGSSSWTIEPINGPCNWSASYGPTDWSCPGCPIINGPLSASVSACAGDFIPLNTYANQVSFSDPFDVFQSFQWYSDAELTQPVALNAFIYNGDYCNVDNFDIYVGLICDVQAEPIPAGTLNISIFPNFIPQAQIPTLISTTSEECMPPTLTINCAGALAATPVPGTVPFVVGSGENGTAQWTLSYYGFDCLNQIVEVPYMCPQQPECPIFATGFETQVENCSGNELDLSEYEAQVFFIGGYQAQITGFAWFENEALSIPLSAQSWLHNGADPCTPEFKHFYLGYYCTFDDGITIPPNIVAGILEVITYPDYDAGLIFISDEGDACNNIPPTVAYACPEFEISLNDTTAINPIIPGDVGNWSYNISLYNPLGQLCVEETYSVPFECPVVCEAVDVVSTAPATACNNDQIHLEVSVSTPENASLHAIPGIDYTLQWYRNGVLVPSANNQTSYNPTLIATGCDPATYYFEVVYNCLNPGDSTITHNMDTVVVYPDFDASFLSTDSYYLCEQPEITVNCDNYTATLVQIPQSSGAGSVVWDITYNIPEGQACWSGDEQISTFYTCTCPTVSGISNGNISFCYDEAIDFSTLENQIVLNGGDTGTNGGFGWFTDAAFTQAVPADFGYQGDSCTIFTQTVYVAFFCTGLDTTVLAAGNAQVNIYPPYNPDFVQENIIDDCTPPQLIVNCDTYTLTPVNVPAQINMGDNGTATWNISVSDCWMQPYEIDYYCPSCPDISTPLAQNISICTDDAIDFASFENMVVINDVDTTFDGYDWYEDAGLTILANSSYTHSGNDNCVVESISLYLGLHCTLISEPIAAGTLNIDIYPAYDVSLIQIPATVAECEVPTVSTTCTNYVITPSANNINMLNPGDTGNNNWTITYNTNAVSCFSENISIPYNCPPCPTVTTPLSASTSICSGDNINIASYENDIVLSTTLTFTNYTWYSDAALTQIINNLPNSIQHSGGNTCSSESLTYYVAANCTLDSNPIPAGILTVNVYPPYDATLITINDGVDCVAPTVTTTCNNYNISADANNVSSIPANQTGNNNFTITFNDGTGYNCFTTPISLPYACPTCPQITTPLNETIDLCPDDSFTFATYQTQISMQYNETFDGFSWYEDAALSIPAGSPLSYQHSGNDNCAVETVTLYVAASCTFDPTLISAGQLTLNLYPAYDASLLYDATPAGDCEAPVLMSTCANYQLTPSANNVSNLTPGQTGSNSWTVTYGNTNCFSETYSLPYSCQACPVAATVNIPANVCNNDAINLQANISPASAVINIDYSLQWLEDGNPIAGATNTSFVVNASNNSNCDALQHTYTLAFTCLIPGDAPQNISVGTVNIYPDYDANLINVTNNECEVPSISSTCANYVISAVNVPANLQPGDNGTATWQIDFNAGNCWSENFTVNYNCPYIPSCPSVTTALNANTDICNGGTPNFSSFESQVQISDIDNLADGFAWYSDAALSQTLTPSDYAHSGNNNCVTETKTLYLALICNNNGNISEISAGTLAVTVFPAYDANLVQLNEGDCASPTINLLCNNYIATANSNNNPNINPGDSGFYEWTITYNDGVSGQSCFSQNVQAAYTCGEVCPVANISVAAPASACNGDVINLSLSVSPASAVINVDYSVQWMLNNSPIPLATGLNYASSISNIDCNVSQSNFSVQFTCLVPGDAPQFLDAGTVTIYPDYNDTFITFTNPDCNVPQISSTCVEYIITPINVPANVNAGESGIASWNISYDGGNCWADDILYEVPYNCPEGPVCPQVTQALSASENLCVGDVPNLSSYENQITISDPDQLSGGIEWFADAAMTIPASSLNYDHSGADKCEPEQIQVFAGLICTNNPQPISAGSLTLTLYPNYDASFIQTTEGDCVASTINTTCANYVLTAATSNISGAVAAGDSGYNEWTITYNGIDCISENISVYYACGPVCPSAIIVQNAPSEVCNGESVSISLQVSPQSALINTDYTISWLQNGNVVNGQNGTSFSYNATANSCDPVVYNIQAVFTCLIPGDNPETISFTPTTVYPSIDLNFIQATNDECIVPSIISTCANYTISPVSDIPDVLDYGDFGSITWEVAYTGTTCPTETYTISYVCPELPEVIPEPAIFIPNAFSPNGDGINEVFRAFGNGIEEFSMHIYDRWGNAIFETNDILGSWDGTYEGKPVEMDVYVYYVNVKFNNGTEDILKGNVSLIR
ncbi:MAG: gliding motility-associated C-terminal domain-containing protein [Bacteroidetes bacterium]|nr:gliding motility-associated C-terminal domain-containing protein [Bacteroidota bacterium]